MRMQQLRFLCDNPAFLHIPVKWTEPLTCDKWDCDCTFTRQRGCCCAANEMFQLEQDTFARVQSLWHDISTLSSRVLQHSGDRWNVHKIGLLQPVSVYPCDSSSASESVKMAFKATMDPNNVVMIPGSNERCFGPFNTNVPIPYATVALNHGQGYNPSWGRKSTNCRFRMRKPPVTLLPPSSGVFTAPSAGVYLFSYTVYSLVEKDARIYHKVREPERLWCCC